MNSQQYPPDLEEARSKLFSSFAQLSEVASRLEDKTAEMKEQRLNEEAELAELQAAQQTAPLSGQPPSRWILPPKGILE